ncbi:hypothetical protein CALVIDRAFT_569442 [Calocera viscosa TUFC12733]|uniref:Uncharacterized protein n=1 Tax=Calocera viscosa (strain TUFC12733) TaxID=1330018 RepID=A0A167FZR8_CALVF|nr:hypothetical protein CALVIDRAFT_569442 [Calocera viscosa TUFC12733]
MDVDGANVIPSGDQGSQGCPPFHLPFPTLAPLSRLLYLSDLPARSPSTLNFQCRLTNASSAPASTELNRPDPTSLMLPLSVGPSPGSAPRPAMERPGRDGLGGPSVDRPAERKQSLDRPSEGLPCRQTRLQ